jgi:hypothetical protein
VTSANGAGDTFTFGNGNNTVTANGGGGDSFAFGNGKNTVTANGNGNIGGTFGHGNNTLTSTGSGGTWTFDAAAASVDKATIGSNQTINQNGGTLQVTETGAGNLLNLNGSKGTVNAQDNSEVIRFTNGAGAAVTLNPAANSDVLDITGTGNAYKGAISIANLTDADTVNLNGIYDASNVHITSLAQLLTDTNYVHTGTGTSLALAGGGSLAFSTNTVFATSSFHFS